ncbi:MAG: glycerate kinase [Chthoniobacteraceae bacterium]
MRILVAPDKFKGSITAVAAADAIVRGWRRASPGDEFDVAPIADGGEGFAETLCGALAGEWIACEALDPLGRKISARYAWVAERKLAIIDMSEASGLWRLKPEERAPVTANTFGTGQLIRDAATHGAKTILIGLGGSATTDGGIGMAAALGYEMRNAKGEKLEAIPSHLASLSRVVSEDVIQLPEIIAACDVQNPLLGPRGTAHVFSPQKGADARTVEELENAMARLADVVANDLGGDFRNEPGAGAAGGLGFGLMSFCGAKIRSGFDVVAETLGLAERIAASDLVITGEGRLDDQTLDGKGPAGVAALAHARGRRVLAFAGSVSTGAPHDRLFDATCGIIDEPVPLETAMERGAEFLERAAWRAARLFHLALQN